MLAVTYTSDFSDTSRPPQVGANAHGPRTPRLPTAVVDEDVNWDEGHDEMIQFPAMQSYQQPTRLAKHRQRVHLCWVCLACMD